jgi:hypothetical protein
LASKIEAIPRASSLERCGTINEKHGVIDVVFLAKFRKERVSENGGSNRLKLCVK